MTEKINKEELSLLKHTKSLLKGTKCYTMPYVVTTSECGYAFLLTFCHSANKSRYAQIISGYVPVINVYVYKMQKCWTNNNGNYSRLKTPKSFK